MYRQAEAAPARFSSCTWDRNCRARHTRDRNSHAAIRIRAGHTSRRVPNTADLQTHAD